MLLSGHRCDACYGSGTCLYYKANKVETHETCIECRGTGREMSDLCRELFDVLAEHFNIKPKERGI